MITRFSIDVWNSHQKYVKHKIQSKFSEKIRPQEESLKRNDFLNLPLLKLKLVPKSVDRCRTCHSHLILKIIEKQKKIILRQNRRVHRIILSSQTINRWVSRVWFFQTLGDFGFPFVLSRIETGSSWTESNLSRLISTRCWSLLIFIVGLTSW